MASREVKETLNPAKRVRPEAECSRSEDANEEEEEEEESQLEDFEREVKEMAQKIIDLRRSIPERLGDVASSTILSSLRPKLPPALGSIATNPAGADSSSRPVDGVFPDYPSLFSPTSGHLLRPISGRLLAILRYL
ncbi:hypothetical protein KSP40_PGU012789 [Platanthera guangdongensis]|uniref:Uncharacterized protein n=1 Tax=Platanthera guangdongensis TaxID=2320717 RepID=A0ABR2MRM7_9ASPA